MNLKNSEASLAEELPYWDFAKDPFPHIVLSDGSLVAGLNVSLIDVECLDINQVNQLALSLRSALNSIPEGISLQFCVSVGSDYSETVRAHKDGFAKDMHPLIAKMAEARVETLSQAIDQRELYRPILTVFARVPTSRGSKGGFFKTEKEFSSTVEYDYEDQLSQLSEALDGLISSFRSLGSESRKLELNEMVGHVYAALNPSRSNLHPSPKLQDQISEVDGKVLEESPWLGADSPRSQLAFGDLVLGYDSFILDSKIHKVISLKTLPEITFAAQLSNVLRLPFHYDLILSFHIPPQAQEMAGLERRRRMAHSLASTPGGGVSDLESETKLNSTESLIRELLTTGQRIYAAQFQFILKADVTTDGEKMLARQSREILTRIRALQGAEGLEETVGAWKVLKGTLPGAPLHLERAKKLKTNNLADFLPIYGPSLGDPNPVVIFRNRLNGLFSFDAFDSKLSNFNALVTGTSGAGKSFMNNLIVAQELARSQRLFIVDVGGSYKKLTEALGGQYIEINLSEANRINPLHLDDPSKPPSDQKLKTLVACIESMVADEDKGRLPKIDRVLLEKEIVELYEDARKREENPILSDLSSRLERSKESSMKTLAKMLYTWTGQRPYGRLVDGEGALRADAGICTFDLKGLSSYPDLQRVMILILTDFIITQVESDRRNRKRIILDEAWQLLKSSSAADFMEYCARTLRKSGSGITFITQGVEEIASSPIGSAILNNTATKFVLLQRGDMGILARNLKLNAQEVELISKLEQRKGQFSEAFLIKGEVRQVIRICPTPQEYWLATSDAQDNDFLERLKTQGLSMDEALAHAATEFPMGMAQGKVAL